VRVFHLYRQRIPAAAPQALQILSTCHALAAAGAEVTLLADPPLEGIPGEAVLEDYGLPPEPNLRLDWLRARGRTLAGVEWRARLATWMATGDVLFSRRVDYAASWLRWRERFGGRFRVVHEWHYVASANAREAGEIERAAALERDEATVRELADGHVTVSSALADYVGPTRGPLEVIANGGPSPTPWERPERPAVVYAGLFRRTGDLDALLEAAGDLDADVIVAGGDEGGEKLAAVQARATDRIRFTGALAPVKAREVLKRGSVAVATFADSVNMRHFACPLKILEAHAAGVPVVASDFPTVRELVDPDRTGILVPPGDGRALSAAIRRVLGDEDLARRLSIAGREVAATRTWSLRGRRLYDFLGGLP
jgi:glycosyltransferase involved in cell wall biosynthesis